MVVVGLSVGVATGAGVMVGGVVTGGKGSEGVVTFVVLVVVTVGVVVTTGGSMV